MKIEYSYGLMGYFMKYLGGIFLVLISVLLAFFIMYGLFGGLLSKEPLKVALSVIIFIPVIWLFLWGAYYCFKYAKLFTVKFVFNGFNVEMYSGNRPEAIEKDLKINKVIYRSNLFLFIIYFENEKHKEIILMNNGSKSESSEFLLLKQLLLSHPNAIVKWW